MSDIIIEVDNLGKLYYLGELHKQTHSFREKLTNLYKNKKERKKEETIWALKNVSLQVKESEVVGIIGRNGAGKTTLLKILSRITKPTEGYAKIQGSVRSLLEVGTGFHPELTGRENVYLSGIILGMKKAEIKQKFDEIVAFSEIEKFIDTPVKRYSSGMYVRLAFAVAAHLEPKILLVDEVLAVGDVAFQKKCLGKMDGVAKEGRTVLFVSHNMAAISSLCLRAILLKNGQKVADDIASKVVDQYLQEKVQSTQINLKDRKDRIGNGQTRFTQLWIENSQNQKVDIVTSGQEVYIVVAYESIGISPLRNPCVAFALRGPHGEKIADLWNQSSGYSWDMIPANGIIKCKLPRFPLNAGVYTISVYLEANGVLEDWVEHACRLIVHVGDFFGTGSLPKAKHGYFFIDQDWLLVDI